MRQEKYGVRSAWGVLILWVVGFSGPVLAHHPMGGEAPSTILQGLLSGLGHPVIEIDHLAFLICLGLLTSLVDQGRHRLIFPFVAISLASTFVHASGVSIPLPEMWVGLSLLVVAGLLLRALKVGTGLAVLFCIFAGIAHGYAFGEAVVGVRTSTLASYLVGLFVIQSAMLWLIATGVERVLPSFRKVMFVAGGALSALLGVYALAGVAL